nr:RNA-directed DNA polymerase like [Tanacetum cinerariifolium]
MLLDLPVLTTSLPKETLLVYLAASKEAVSEVLLEVMKGKQHLVHYVSRTLHNAERNYAPLEKMSLALRHVSRRLGMYFKAHPINLITDQPINQILNKADTSCPLPEAPGKVKFVIVAVDNFTKWIEAKPLAKTTRKEVKKFL